MSKYIKFNINDDIKFKLTPKGLEIIEKINKTDPTYKRFPKEFIPDEDGYCHEQLWCMMDFWGPYMAHGSSVPFETNIYFKIE